MTKNISNQLIICMCSCILQSRVNVDKEQISSFNQFLMNLNKIKEEAHESNLELVFKKLTRKQIKQVREKVVPFEGKYQVMLNFMLRPLHEENKIAVQTWILTLEQQRNYIEHFDETFITTSLIFQELLFLLTTLPIYTQFIRDKSMKKQYQICYNFIVNSLENALQYRKLQTQQSLSHFQKVYHRQRLCSSFKVSVKCYSFKSIHNQGLLKQKRLKSAIEGQKAKKIKKHQNRLKSSSSLQYMHQRHQQNQQFIDLNKMGERKLSLYQMYDDDLGCTLLSSSQSSFSSSPKSVVKQIKFFPKDNQVEEQQFQMLQFTPDELFINDNKARFKQLSDIQKKLLKEQNL